jgi:putative FmdB family regulatory protein
VPIYEFYCPDCHTVFHFLARVPDTAKRPACPRCARPRLARRPSAFAISRGRAAAAAADDDPEGGDPARLERTMAELAREAEDLGDGDDPRQTARLMRRLFDGSGMPLGPGMEEALRRLEAGEDPDRIEEEMGDALEGEMDGIGDALEGRPDAAAGVSGALRRLRRRLAAPRVDPTLHEL